MTLLYQKVQNKPGGARKSPCHQGDGRQNVLRSPPFWAATDRRDCGVRASIHERCTSLAQARARVLRQSARVARKCLRPKSP